MMVHYIQFFHAFASITQIMIAFKDAMFEISLNQHI